MATYVTYVKLLYLMGATAITFTLISLVAIIPYWPPGTPRTQNAAWYLKHNLARIPWSLRIHVPYCRRGFGIMHYRFSLLRGFACALEITSTESLALVEDTAQSRLITLKLLLGFNSTPTKLGSPASCSTLELAVLFPPMGASPAPGSGGTAV